jgi:hypothetical protein
VLYLAHKSVRPFSTKYKDIPAHKYSVSKDIQYKIFSQLDCSVQDGGVTEFGIPNAKPRCQHEPNDFPWPSVRHPIVQRCDGMFAVPEGRGGGGGEGRYKGRAEGRYEGRTDGMKDG